MSASLVGSEMCIRDRPCPSRARSSPRPPAFVGGPPHDPAARSATTAPVSYTHLTLPTICSV
eukprot:3114566-Alexandrium_andersonii.AAC.1